MWLPPVIFTIQLESLPLAPKASRIFSSVSGFSALKGVSGLPLARLATISVGLLAPLLTSSVGSIPPSKLMQTNTRASSPHTSTATVPPLEWPVTMIRFGSKTSRDRKWLIVTETSLVNSADFAAHRRLDPPRWLTGRHPPEEFCHPADAAVPDREDR